jgi:hypothetical protein
MTVFLLNLSLMALWVASTGAFSYANSALGFLVGFVVLWWLQPLLGTTAYFRKLPLEVCVACVDHLKRAPHARLDFPGCISRMRGSRRGPLNDSIQATANCPGPDAAQRHSADAGNVQRSAAAGYRRRPGCAAQSERENTCQISFGRGRKAWCSAWCFSWWNGVHRTTSGVIEWPPSSS